MVSRSEKRARSTIASKSRHALVTAAKDARRRLQRCESWQLSEPISRRAHLNGCKHGGTPLLDLKSIVRCLRTTPLGILGKTASDERLHANSKKALKHLSGSQIKRSLQIVDDALAVVHLLRHLVMHDEMWISEQEQIESADLEHLLLQLRQVLTQALVRRLVAVATSNALPITVTRSKGMLGGLKSTTEYADNKRPLSTTWPWSIRPSLAVLWGVCWMFYDYDASGVRRRTERRNDEDASPSRRMQQISQQMFFNDPVLRSNYFPIPTDNAYILYGQQLSGNLERTPRVPNEVPSEGGEGAVPGSSLTRLGIPLNVSIASTGGLHLPVTTAASNFQASHTTAWQRYIGIGSNPAAAQSVGLLMPYDSKQGQLGLKTLYAHSSALPPPSYTESTHGHVDNTRRLDIPGLGLGISGAAGGLAATQSTCAGGEKFLPYDYRMPTFQAATSAFNSTQQRVGKRSRLLEDTNYLTPPQTMGLTHQQLPINPELLPPLHDRSDGGMPEAEPPQKRRRVSDTDSRRLSAGSEQPYTHRPTDEDEDSVSLDPSDTQEFSARRGYTFKRSGEPPKNDENKYVCQVDERCRALTFDRKCEWGKHMDKHERPYRCDRPECSKLNGFTYSGGLLRHQREVHKMHGSTQKLFCPEPNCKRATGAGFTRKENLYEHLRRVHRRTSATHDFTVSPGETNGDHHDPALKPITPVKRAQDAFEESDHPESAEHDIHVLREQLMQRDAIIRARDERIQELENMLAGSDIAHQQTPSDVAGVRAHESPDPIG